MNCARCRDIRKILDEPCPIPSGLVSRDILDGRCPDEKRTISSLDYHRQIDKGIIDVR